MRRVLVVGAVVAAVCGCASLFSSSTSPYTRDALVNDVAVKKDLDSGYDVVAVDGKPVDRVRGSFITYVPFVIVKPGVHTLSLEPSAGDAPQATTVSATFEAGKRYRIKRENDAVTVIEDESYDR